MAVFADLDWRRFDVHAIVSCGGVATIDPRRRIACHDWLRAHGYRVESLDLGRGLAAAIPVLGARLRWEKQFGYALGPDNRNLDALRDGFEFEVPDIGGLVFELPGSEVAWQEDPRWLLGLLAIVGEYSRTQLALGKRFFVLVVLDEDSPLIGTAIEETRVPGPFWSPAGDIHEFRT